MAEHTIKTEKRANPPYNEYVLIVNGSSIEKYNNEEKAELVAENLREALEHGDCGCC